MPRKKRLPIGERVVNEVREWIGTPFHDQASLKGVGCDCKGLVWGVARALGRPEANTSYAEFIHYDLKRRNGVPGKLLRQGMAALFDRADQIRPGDILLLSCEGEPRHMAIATDEGFAIHASGKRGVKERSLKAVSHKYQIDSIWRWRGV